MFGVKYNEALLFIKKARQQEQLEKMGITGEIKQVTLAQFNQNIIQQSIQKKSQDVNPKAGQAKKDIYIAQGQKEHLSHNNKESRNGETQLEENTIMVSNSRNRNINQMADNNNVVANLAYDTQKNSSISFKKYVDKKLDEDLIKDIVNDVIDQVKKNGKLTESQLNDLESILNKEDNSLFGIFNSVSRGVLVIKLALELSKTGYVSVTKKEGKYELRNVSKKEEQGSNKNEQPKKNDDIKDDEKEEVDQKDNDDGKYRWGMGEDGPPDGRSEKGKENDKGTGEGDTGTNEVFDYEWTGKYVTADFKAKVLEISRKLQIDPDDLMGIMAFESNGIDPSCVNKISGATGLIQFMPSTAKDLGTTTKALAKMSAVKQLDYVYEYYKPYAGKIRNIEDAYMVVLMPIAVGKDNDFILGIKDSSEELAKSLSYGIVYKQNSVLDINKDGIITKGEAAQKVVDTRNKYKKTNQEMGEKK